VNSCSDVASGYRRTAKTAAAKAGSTTESAGIESPAAPFMRLPDVSKGLPPPLPSSRLVSELPWLVVVLEGELVGLAVFVVVVNGAALDDDTSRGVVWVGLGF